MKLHTFALLVLLSRAAIAGDTATPWAHVIRNSDPSTNQYRYSDHIQNLHVVLDLLRNGCQVDWIDSVGSKPTSKIRRGDYLVVMNQPESARAEAILGKVPPSSRTSIEGAASFTSYPLNYPRIMVDAQIWASNYYWYYDTLLAGGFAFEHVYDFEQQSLTADRCNLYVAPGGGGQIPAAYNDVLQTFVKARGNYLGSCWGCAQALYPSKVSYGNGNGAGIADAYNNEVVRSFGALGGVGHVVLRNDAPEHPIMWDLPATIDNIYWNGPVMRPGTHAQALASLLGVVESDFRFRSKDPEQRVMDAEEEVSKCLYLASQRPGEGKVAVFGNHPEASDGVNPFAAHAMGHKATFNAILFLTAGEKRKQTLVMPPPRGVTTAREVVSDASDLTVAIRPLADELLATVKQLLAADDKTWTEDDHSGFYVLRLRDALQNLATRRIGPTDFGDSRAAKLQTQFSVWHERTTKTLQSLAERLKDVDMKSLDGRNSTKWHPIVCPLYERSIELTHLARDFEIGIALK